jgi:ribose 1,5-bisphosphokinase
MAGALVLVVGPSGAGKDTLIAAARDRLAGDPRFVFARRMVTRDAVAEVEDHDTISRQDFATGRDSGAFALCWEAHGLGYALPRSIEPDVAAGRVVVANGSRAIVGEAVRRYPSCRVLLIDADPAVRAQRLLGRGRESA